MNLFKIKRKFVILVIVFFSIIFFSKHSFAYDEVIVHPSLTSEMAKLYNLNYNEKLTGQEIDWMKKGSTDEDARQGLLIRSGNHFYNPFGIKKWADNTLIGNSVPEPKLTSKEWAHDSLEQDSFPGGDYTWERAIWDYANGDKQHAYESLGHIMHLIEDSTVPAHVRNDLHISPNDKDLAPYEALPYFEEIKKSLQDGEPYEAWTGGQAWSQNLKYDFANSLQQKNKKPLEFKMIDEYFDNIAQYTNTNFFSKDTIYAYSEPNNHVVEGTEETVDGKIDDYVYGFDENNNKIKLAKIFEDINTKQKVYDVSDKEDEIHSDYWSRLAPKSILAGAGIIKLFKDEAEKAAKNPMSVQKPPIAMSSYIIDSISNEADEIGSSVVAFYDYGKDTINSAAGMFGDFLNSSMDSVSQYFTPSAEAQLVFDISNPLSDGIYTIEDIIKQSETIPIADAQIINEPIYDGNIQVLNQNQNLSFAPREEIALTAQIKNTGTAAWQGDKISLNIYIDQYLGKKFYHSSWLTAVRPASLGKAEINPGAAAIFNFTVTAPTEAGDYYFRVRPVWQSESDEFNWMGEDILSWAIQVQAPEIVVAEIPITDQENIAAKNDNTEIIPDVSPEPSPTIIPDDDLLPEEIDSGDKIIDTFAIAEARRQKELEEYILRRRRAAAKTPPKTTIVEFPETSTFETAAFFRFSSSKVNSIFFCSLDESDFAYCEEDEEGYATFNGLASGEHILKVKAEDGFGNIEKIPAEYSWTVNEYLLEKISGFTASTGPDRATVDLSWARSQENLSYEIRYSVKEIVDNKLFDSQILWEDASAILDVIPAGTFSVKVGRLTNLLPGKIYYFAIKGRNQAGNGSEISDSVFARSNGAAGNVVISEIQISGATADDEFIELYNPTGLPVDLSGWSIQYRGGDAITYQKKNFGSESIIASHGYFLIAHGESYTGIVSQDMSWSQSLSGIGGTIFLVSNQDDLAEETDGDSNIIDKISYGTGSDNHLRPETAEFTPAPLAGQSLERKANLNSTSRSMSSAGSEMLGGNGWDANDNSADFILQNIPDPQNYSQRLLEPRKPELIG